MKPHDRCQPPRGASWHCRRGAVMKKQRPAHLGNLSSSAGHTVYTAAGVRSATKSAVIAIAETLRQGRKGGPQLFSELARRISRLIIQNPGQ